jgi:mono/diheme cytochrome c family protein
MTMKLKMIPKQGVLYVALAFSMAAVILVACSKGKEKKDETQEMTEAALAERGKYLMMVSACHDCHSPKKITSDGQVLLDEDRLLSGHPKDEPLRPISGHNDWILFSQGLTSFVGPWGISYAANLTPDDTGTGNWTFEQFKTAIRKGKYKGMEGSRSLLPPMPWEVYQYFTDDDLKAIFTYLRTLKPIDNLVPAPVAFDDIPKEWLSKAE